MEKLSILVGIAMILALALAALPAAAADTSQVVNINQADADQLALLPRVGPALAGRIIEFRDENGKFEEPEDLMLVRGIGEKTFELMEPFVAVSGETTLSRKLKVSELESRKPAAEKDE